MELALVRLFETFKAKRAYISAPASASLYASGRTTGLVVEVGHDRVARNGLERQRGNEAPRVVCHDRRHTESPFGQLARDVDRLVGGDRAGDAEHDVFEGCAHDHSLSEVTAGGF